MERRNFVKSTCNICLLGAAGIFTARLTSCSPPAFPVFRTGLTDNTIVVPANLFDKSPVQIVRAKNMFYDIAVKKNEDNSYSAMQLLCTHQQTQLNVTGNGYTCPLHGSQFDKNGNVKKGPAEKSLHQFKTFISDNNIIIEI